MAATSGRPRDPDVDRRILHAAFELLTTIGYAQMSVERVAADAGVGKTAIYRRYPGKRELAAAAMLAFTQVVPPPPRTELRAGLAMMLKQGREALIGQRALTMVGTLLVEEVHDPELLRVFRERILLPRRAIIRDVLEHAQANGEIGADVDLELVLDLLAGALFAHHLTGSPVNDEWIDHLVVTLQSVLRGAQT